MPGIFDSMRLIDRAALAERVTMLDAIRALQASLRQRNVNGFEYLASYTLSETRTNNLGYYGSGCVAAEGAPARAPRALARGATSNTRSIFRSKMPIAERRGGSR